MFSLGIQFALISRVKEYKRRANNFEKGEGEKEKEKKIKRERNLPWNELSQSKLSFRALPIGKSKWAEIYWLIGINEK